MREHFPLDPNAPEQGNKKTFTDHLEDMENAPGISRYPEPAQTHSTGLKFMNKNNPEEQRAQDEPIPTDLPDHELRMLENTHADLEQAHSEAETDPEEEQK